MITVHLESGQARNELAEIGRLLGKPRVAMQAAGRGARKLLQGHFRNRDRTANKLGGRRTHFWLDIYKSTQLGPVTDTSVTVTIGDHRFAQKVFGGRIVAKVAKALSIPVDPEAHGRRPEVFERETGLDLVFIKQRNNALLATRVEGSEALRVRYLLVPFVDQAPDPEALPPREQIEQAAVDAAQAQLQAAIRAAQKK